MDANADILDNEDINWVGVVNLTNGILFHFHKNCFKVAVHTCDVL